MSLQARRADKLPPSNLCSCLDSLSPMTDRDILSHSAPYRTHRFRYIQAAESDSDHSASAVAANNLSNCYTSGWGTEVNLPEAARWLERAVALGDGSAAFNLGNRYEHARGVPCSVERAFELYKMAASLGNPRATFNVANCLRNGWGCDVNEEAAVLLYALAAQNGVPQARGEFL
jgi:TPR repeat protein